ncbi:hypothetical protein CXB51_025636 [Gossypium anomalum]|uniref:Uncharacterized protein n=1 Tax=Gossypium anomalum TaxID=47600 RepID=A0A8J6CSP3_9ROSI|nr:hypothetical protein CXB51_025636 [Gossypium anomalum]
MLQRSSSTPVFGALIFPFTDSPNKDLDATYRLLQGNHGGKLDFHCQESLNLTSFSHNSSPESHSASGLFEFNPESGGFRLKGFRRAKSEGSIERLDYRSCDIAQFLDPRTPKRSFHRHHITIWKLGEESLERTVTIGENIDAVGNPDFSFRKKCMELIQEEEGDDEKKRLNRIRVSYNDEEEVELEPPSPPMYLATGLGVDCTGFGAMADGVDLSYMDFDEVDDQEEFHKRLVDEYPCHPLFLRNYAKFTDDHITMKPASESIDSLYNTSKGDLQGAEDYYHRATLADPEDSEILLQYAKILWDLHHDKDRALSYFERAVQASPQDSNVLGAYASFLWEIGDDAEEYGEQEHQGVKEEEIMKVAKNSLPEEETKLARLSMHLPNPAGLGVHTDIQDIDIEDYHTRMVQENPGNPSVLSNYARFLHQVLKEMLKEPRNTICKPYKEWETMSHYAKLIWDSHRDHDKASHYFELAVEANPENSNILAAYASFLWETEEDEDNNTRQDQTQVSLQNRALSAINS